jgi:hypothetical protein
MAEPQPSTVHEGAADPHAPTSTASDRAAAAALSTLDTAPESENNGAKKEVDGKALDKAMQGLNVKDNKDEEEKKKNVKIEAGDVTLLVRFWIFGEAWRDTLGLGCCGLTGRFFFRSTNLMFRNKKLRNCCARMRVMRLRR